MTSLLDQVSEIGVSSCSDPKEFGKKSLLDGREDTCWSSSEGPRQWIRVAFKRKVSLEQLDITFQGGFSSRQIKLQQGSEREDAITFHPVDNNNRQSFKFPSAIDCDTLRIVFEDPTDFYGRIVVYTIDLIGR